MTRKTIAQKSGNSGWVNISGPKLDMLDAEGGDDIEVDVADTKDVARAIIDSNDADRILIVTPR